MPISKQRAKSRRKKPWNPQRKKQPKPKKKRGAMIGSYCTNNQCDSLEIQRISRPGDKCSECGYPLSWLGKTPEQRNKYADGPVNSGSADRWN